MFTRTWQPDLSKWDVTFTESPGRRDVAGAARSRRCPHAGVRRGRRGPRPRHTSGVVADLTLPTTCTHGTTITWSTSDAAAVSATGDVTRPEAGAGDAHVTLTAQVANGTEVRTVTFDVVVLQRVTGGVVGSWSF